jgi:cytochrome c-type biogenesis protein CcmH/NrfG
MVPGGEAGGPDAATLRARKAALQASLQDLEAEFAAGRLDPRDLAMLTERDQAELTAVTEALRRVKKDTNETAAAPKPLADSGTGRWMARLGWVVALGAFALVLVLSLRGSVAARSEGGVITGSQTASAAPVEMELQQTGPLDSLRIAQLEARVRRDSGDAPALIELGHIYLAQGMLEKAWLVDTLAIRLQPDAPASAEAFVHIGMILWSQGETDGGLRAIDKALYLHPELPEALLYRGIIFFAGLKDMRAAAQTFEHYLAVAPPDANTARVRAMLNAARQGAGGQ